jgi:hypothetical protein
MGGFLMKLRKMLLLLMCWVGLLLPTLTLALEITTGLSFFKTVDDGNTSIDLSSIGGPIKIPLQGNAKPLTKFNSELLNKIGDMDQASLAAIDTVVEIKENKGINFSKGGEITGEIELIALSLKSINPLDLGFLRSFPKGTTADLYMTVGITEPSELSSDSTRKPSLGKMVTRYERDDGGSLDFKLEVYPNLILVKTGGDLNNPQDRLLATSYTGKPIIVSGNGTWRSDNGIFKIIEAKSTEHHMASLIAYSTQLDILSLAALPSSVGGLSTSTLEIKPGFTLLKTAETEETSLDLKSVGGPQVLLKGNAEQLTKFTHELISNDSLSAEQFASIDAVVELKQAINVNPDQDGEVTGEAELVGLSLKSIKLLDIGFLNSFPKGTLADLYVTVGVVDLSKENNNFTKKPSTGKITLRYEKDSGGSFKCTLGVYPDLIFVKAGGDFNNRKDWLLPTQSPGGKPFSISGTGTWRSEKGKFIITEFKPSNDITGLLDAIAEPVIHPIQQIEFIPKDDLISTALSLPAVGTKTVMDAQINTKVAVLSNPNLSSLLLATFAKDHINCDILVATKTLKGLEQRDLQITSLQQEFILPAEAGLGNAIKISINPKKTSTGTIISNSTTAAYPATQTVNLFVTATVNGMTLVNKEPIVFVGEITQWPPNGSLYYQQKSVDFYMADNQLESQGNAIMQFTVSEVQLFAGNSLPQPSPGTIQFSQPEYKVNENQGRVTAWVERHGGSQGDIVVKYGTTSLTAQAGVDYQPLSGELMWSDGEMTSKPIDVAIVNDNEREADEIFYVTLLDSPGNPNTPQFNKPLHVPVTIEDDDFIKITLPPVIKSLPIFTPINVTIINPLKLPTRLFSFSMKSTKDRDDDVQLFDDQSLAFISSLPDTLAELNLPEFTLETDGQMSRLELPIFSAADSQLPQAWYSVWVGNPVELASQEEAVTGIITNPAEEIAYLVFEGQDGKYYQSPLYPALHPQILAALAEAFPQATFTLAAEGRITFTQGNEISQVKVSYEVTPSGLDTEPLTVKPLDGNFLELSAHGRRQLVQLVKE